jgi:arsenate reductase (glutaredoxin)
MNPAIVGTVLEIWVNPACSKCRTAVSELDAAGTQYTIRRYLDEPPTAAELEDVLRRMALDPWDIARPKEAKDAGITLPKDAEHRQAWIEQLVANPKAIQRPIITATDGTTVVARDPVTLARVIASER